MGLDHGLRNGNPRPAEDASYEEYRAWREGAGIIQWRKENHIHAWFVCNVQNDVDECEDAVVSWEQLAKFVAACETIIAGSTLVSGDVFAGRVGTAAGLEDIFEPGQVLTEESKALAERVMPTQGGFFFGSTQYSEWYLKSLTEAVEALKPVLLSMAEDDTVIYWSSW